MRLVIYREPLASQVPTNVGKDGVMAGNSHAVSTGTYLQDMVVCFRHHTPRAVTPILVSPPGGSGCGRNGTDSYLVTIDIFSAGKKCGNVRYPLVLVGNLNGVLKRTSFYQAVEKSGPPLLAAFFSAMMVVPSVSRLLHWGTSLARCVL